ncbi:MAG: hypothetical protein V1835_00795 [Candidatus Micrarchaeota archaeon]
MGPLFHFTTNFVMVWIVSQYLGLEFAGAIFVLAMVGGLFPDFTHHKWEFIIAASASFFAAYMFAFNSSGDAQNAFILGAGAIAVLVIIRLNSKSVGQVYPGITASQRTPEMLKDAKLTYSLAYYVAFGLAAFVFTNSWEVGIIAFLCYGLHGLIDNLTYGTWFGLKYMAPYAHI